MRNRRLYFIPGRGETLTNEIGQVITSLRFPVQGREVIGDFERLLFSEQIALIRADLQSKFWHSEAVLIGRSYGAYLLLHTLAELDAFPGKVLLFSPVLGAGISKNGLFGSIPPRAKRLLKLAESKEFPAPQYLEIHTGAEDNGCDPALATRFAAPIENTKLYIVPGAGHQLAEEYLRGVLDSFLGDNSQDSVESNRVLFD